MNIAIINCFDTYEQRVRLLYDCFVDMGNTVKVFTSNFKHVEKIKRTQPPKDYCYVSAMKYKRNISARRMISHIRYSKDIFKKIQLESFDLLWVMIPPNSLVREAIEYKKKHPDIKIIVDIIDMWPETMPISKFKNTKLARMWRGMRDDNLAFADYIVTECDLFKERVEKKAQNRIKTVYYSKEDVRVESNMIPPDDRFSFCYLGSINNIIDIHTIGQVIRMAKKIKPVELHIIGDGENKDKLIQEASGAGAEVIDHGKIYDQKKKQTVFDSCHFGLNMMKKTVCVGLTMKSLDYFSAGLPIINNIAGDTWRLLEKYGAGINYRDGDEIALQFDEQMRKNSRLLFENELSERVFRKKIREVMEELHK